jgi:uncharacterized protein YdhG (YjbR/CyaY superfamily)
MMARNRDVDAWFAKYDNPMKEVVQRMREIVLAADARIGECIKWQAPTFTYLGNLASFFPKSKQHASLMFHQGATIPGSHPRLEGAGDTSRVLKIQSVAEANAARRDIERLVRAWCDWREAESVDVARARSPEKKRASSRAASGKPRRRTRTSSASRKR